MMKSIMRSILSLWSRFFENKKVIIKEPTVPVISKPLKERTVLMKELAKI